MARPLTSDEYSIYAGSASLAFEMIPSFRDAIALLRPFVDEESPSVYVDEYSRIGLVPNFFERTSQKRATTILHETMHVLNNHFSRREALGATNVKAFLMGADFEIGTTLSLHPNTDTSHQIVPDRDPFDYKPHLSFEQYYQIINDEEPEDQDEQDNESGGSGSDGDDSENNSSSSSSDDGDGQDSSDSESSDSGNGESSESGGGSSSQGNDEMTGSNGRSGGAGDVCSYADSERIEAADNANIERASDAETSIARDNTAARISNDLAKSRQAGNSALGQFLGRVQMQLKPPKVSWKSLLKMDVNRAASTISRGRMDYSYKRVNRKFVGTDFILPGMVAYNPKAAMGIDSSGSMQEDDYLDILSEAEGVLKTSSIGREMKFFTIDTQVAGKIETIKSVRDVKIKGGGGTDMAPGFEAMRKLPRHERPDIFILGTDGGFSWDGLIVELKKCKKAFKSIILITDKRCYDAVPDEARSLATILDVSS